MKQIPKRRKEDQDDLLLLEEKFTSGDIYQQNVDLREEVVRLRRELREMTLEAHHDHLTSIFNRKGLQEAFSKTIDYEKGVVIIIDLDHFKPINDTYGHVAGDAALQLVAETLKHYVRQDSDIVARVGGDEFLVVLPGMPLHTAEERLNKLYHTFQGLKLDWNGELIDINATLGMSTYDGHTDETLAKAQREADINMYDRKKAKGAARKH